MAELFCALLWNATTATPRAANPRTALNSWRSHLQLPQHSLNIPQSTWLKCFSSSFCIGGLPIPLYFRSSIANKFSRQILRTPSNASPMATSENLQTLTPHIIFTSDWSIGSTTERTGGGVWSTAVLLTHYFLSHPTTFNRALSNKNALELGSGNGYLSVVLGSVVKDVNIVCTDTPEHLGTNVVSSASGLRDW